MVLSPDAPGPGDQDVPALCAAAGAAPLSINTIPTTSHRQRAARRNPDCPLTARIVEPRRSSAVVVDLVQGARVVVRDDQAAVRRHHDAGRTTPARPVRSLPAR